MTKPVKALLFDLGGVLIDISFDKVFETWARHASVEAETLKSRWRQDEAYEQHERGEISAADYFESLRKSLSINLSDQQFREGWNAIFLGEITETASLLKRLKPHIPLYAFTNNNATHHEKASELFHETLALFEKIFCSFQIAKRKPEANAFTFVASEMGYDLDEIMFFDDSETNAQAAHDLGIETVLVKTAKDVSKAIEALS